MNKEKLLTLINEDEDIRDAILNILNEDKPIIKIEKEKEEIEMLKAVIKRLKTYFSNEEAKTESLNQDVSKLQKVKDELETLNKELKSKKDKLTSINNDLQNNVEKLHSDNKTIQNSNTKLNKTIEFYRDNFEEELTAYELFSSLSTDTKVSLSGIFKDSTLKGFLSCGVQDKNISSFWEYIKTELQEDKNSDIKNLIQIYDFLFQKYMRAFPMYEVQKTLTGDEFEALSHINHSSSKAVSGTITKVLLKGYINTKTSKIMKKSVVRVG